MTTVRDIMNYLEQIAPLKYQMDYDNAGLLTGSAGMQVSKVLVSLDCTEEIVEEAVQKSANVILSHHPIIFKGLKQLIGKNYIERTVIKAIKNDIALLAWHTNLDSVMSNGVNQMIARRLGLSDIEILDPYEGMPEVGSGMIGKLNQTMLRSEFFEYVKESMELNILKCTKGGPEKIEHVAICGGSGSFLIPAAKKRGADVFITGDIKYHDFFDGENEMTLIDIGHYESEKYTIDLLHSILQKKFSTFAVLKTGLNTNPVEFYQ
jgi:dinuclear metal center YbgI/SA1388 family protein